MIVNVLDYSAAVLPVTTADKSIDKPINGYKPLNKIDEKVSRSCMQTMPSHKILIQN